MSPAIAAERTDRLGARKKRLDFLPTLQEFELALDHSGPGHEGGTTHPPAHRAVIVHDELERGLRLVANGPAETLPFRFRHGAEGFEIGKQVICGEELFPSKVAT